MWFDVTQAVPSTCNVPEHKQIEASLSAPSPVKESVNRQTESDSQDNSTEDSAIDACLRTLR